MNHRSTAWFDVVGLGYYPWTSRAVSRWWCAYTSMASSGPPTTSRCTISRPMLVSTMSTTRSHQRE
jgi:hypothetical protein